MKAPELDFAKGYFGILPAGFRGLKEDEVIFINNCPDDIKKKVLEIWPNVKKRIEEERLNGHWTEVY